MMGGRSAFIALGFVLFFQNGVARGPRIPSPQQPSRGQANSFFMPQNFRGTTNGGERQQENLDYNNGFSPSTGNVNSNKWSSPSKKTQGVNLGGSNWGSSNSKKPLTSNWNSGADYAKPETESYDFVFSSPNEENGWNGNSRKPSSSQSDNSNSISNSWGSSSNQGSSSSGWSSSSTSKKPSKNQSNAINWSSGSSSSNSNNWSSGQNKPSGGQGSNSNNWGFTFESQGNNWNTASTKPSGNLENFNNWNSGSSKPSGNQASGSGSISGSRKPSGNHESSSNNWSFSSSKPSESQDDNSIWNSGSMKPSETQGGSSDNNIWDSSGSKKPSKNQGSNSNNWNSGSTKPTENQSGNSNIWGSSAGSKKPSGNQGSGSSWNSKGETDGGNTNEKPWNSGGSNNQGSSAISKPGAEIDWATIEKENKKSPLLLNLDELWNQNGGKSPVGRPNNPNPKRNNKRDLSKNDVRTPWTCICAEYQDCEPMDRLDFMHVIGVDKNDPRYSKAIECARENKVCCTRRRPLYENNEVAEYEEAPTAGLHTTCGRRPNNSDDINENGQADYGDFPWTLRLVYSDDGGHLVNEITPCGASLIHDSVALTTASCVLDVSRSLITVRAGEWNLETGHSRNKIQDRKVEKILVHPDYHPIQRTSDLALLFLEKPFDGVSKVCLPVPMDKWDISRCTIAGWDRTNEKGFEQRLLRKMDLAIISQGKCRNRFNALQVDHIYQGLESSNFICAYAQDEDPCLSDGAAALICPLTNSPDAFVQVGLFSRRTVCSEPGNTATFVSTWKVIDWIERLKESEFLMR